ncbi:MAG: ribonuclease H-like domain-containing protein [Candidatus Paceibacterota bacterium]|jgi:hypothetical protein
MRTVIFDIETIGEEYGKMDESTQELITASLKKSAASDEEYEAELEQLKDGLGFSPLTGEIVAIGVHDLELEKGVVYFNPGTGPAKNDTEGAYQLKPMNEKEMLEAFWDGLKQYDVIVGFNSRAFDGPFMMIRSLVHGVRPSKDILAGRYLYQQFKSGITHIDLMDQLSFYGASRFKGSSLHMFCRALGVESPKVGGVTGDDVTGLFKAGKSLDIARYNTRDIKATAELYKKWRDTIAF